MYDEVDLSDAYMFCSDRYGINIPMMFAEMFSYEELHLGTPQQHDRFKEDYECIKRGPHDNEWYWDAWNNILDHARLEETLKDGTKRMLYLYQDGDLWMVP